jgi:hypothetical protein
VCFVYHLRVQTLSLSLSFTHTHPRSEWLKWVIVGGDLVGQAWFKCGGGDMNV